MTHPETCKAATGGGFGEQTTITFTTSESISFFCISPAEFLASRPYIHNLVAGTMVFRIAPGFSSGHKSLETLLLQRAPTDSFPLKWEIPAGTAEPSIDHSIAGVAVRELWEETRLRAQRLFCSVGLGLPDGVSNIAMMGEAEDARMDSETNICLLRVSGLTWAIVTFITDIDFEDWNKEVVLQPDEHVAWAWVTEDDVKKQQLGSASGQNLELVSEAMRMTVLEGFKLRNEMTPGCVSRVY